MIRTVARDEVAIIAKIYNHYVENTVATFEENSVSVSTMIRRIDEVITAGLPWIVKEEEGQVLGYAYASKWKPRSAYRFSLESTVYISPRHPGRGIGSELYQALLEKLRQDEYHSVLGAIALPNNASVALHEKLGFVKVAHLHEVGYKLGRWIDVGYWQLILTKGSKAV